MKHLFIAAALLLATTATTAQTAANEQDRHDTALKRLDASLQHTLRTAQPQQMLSAVVSCTDAYRLADRIQADGHRATVITPNTITVRATAEYMRQLGQMTNVSFVQQSRQMLPMMDQARQMSNVDMVHAGSDLETPFTGKGVVVGVIDQGFEFRHVAFLDSLNESRVKWVWNRWGYGQGKDSEPTQKIPATGDGINSTAHATHVTGIAAGSRIAENDWYGVAPEADIIMIPSEFNSAEVLEDVRFIADKAREEGKPWVINMSFGSNAGPHDATDPTFSPIDDIITEQPGGMVVAALGNDGMGTYHAHHVFTAEADTMRLLGQPDGVGIMMDFWCQQTDSASHFSVKPFIYNNGTREYLDETIVSQIMVEEIAPYNGKHHITLTAPTSAVHSYGGYAMLGADIAAQPGIEIHAWTTANFGSFQDGPDASYIVPDKYFTVAEPASSMPHCVAVASYNSRVEYDNLNGQRQTSNYGDLGDISAFSNRGPVLHTTAQPTVAAPGSVVLSALSKYESGFSKTASYITDDVKRGLKHFYYGGYSGTSMATPQVTGAIALWLQANPALTHEQIHQILRESSLVPEGYDVDEYGWNPQWGYGKLNTYEGLKIALLMRSSLPTAINSLQGSRQPVTLMKHCRQWQVLLNNAEPWMRIDVTDLNGCLISSRTVADMNAGHEETIDFDGWRSGIYIVTITTASQRMSRKMALD